MQTSYNPQTLSSINDWKEDEFILAEFIWDVYNSSNTPKHRQNCIDLLNRIPSIGPKKPHVSFALKFFM